MKNKKEINAPPPNYFCLKAKIVLQMIENLTKRQISDSHPRWMAVGKSVYWLLSWGDNK